MIDFILYLGYALLGVAALASLILPLVNAIGNPKTLVKTGAGLVILLVVYGISYAISGSEVTDVYTKFGVDAGASKTIGGVLTMMYLLLMVVVFGVLYTEIAKLFK
jgi:hypothetical protein